VIAADDDDDDFGESLIERLEPLGNLDDEEELVGVGGEEMQIGTLGAEEVGLDDATAFEVLDIAELLHPTDEAEGRWTVGSDVAGDAVHDDALPSATQAEYGWTEGTETASPSDDPAVDLDVGTEERILGDDQGELGVDEVFVLEGRSEDDVGLPPLLALDSEEKLADDLDLAEDAALEVCDDEPTEVPPREEASATHLGPTSEAIVGVEESEGTLFAVGTRLFVRKEGSLVPAAPAGSALTGSVVPTSVVVIEGRVMLGTELDGLVQVVDDRLDSMPTPLAGGDACWVNREGRRLWLRSRAGELFRSEDGGASWAPALATDGAVVALSVVADAVALLVRGADGRMAINTSTDGTSFRSRDVPPLGPDPAGIERMGLAFTEGLVAYGHAGAGGRTLVGRADAAIEPVSALTHAVPMLARKEHGIPVLYAAIFKPTEDRGALLRCPDGEQPRVVLDVRAEREAHGLPARGDAEGDNRVTAVASASDGGLWVGTGAGLFHVRLGPTR
jgi:hypothetical protein